MPVPISLYLMGTRTIRLEIELKEWTAAFEQALRDGTVLQVNDPEDGQTIGVNPRAILYWKTLTQED